jgi:hypothetical protein
VDCIRMLRACASVFVSSVPSERVATILVGVLFQDSAHNARPRSHRRRHSSF